MRGGDWYSIGESLRGNGLVPCFDSGGDYMNLLM